MIIVLLANGFEEIEALTPVDMLRRAGLEVKTVGISGRAPTGAHGIAVVCDALPEEIDLSKVTMAIFPGGMPGAINLDKAKFTDDVISAVIKNGGHLAAICAAPLIFGRRGLLNGKTATCYPGFENELHGATIADEGCVTNGNITTAKAMGSALDFAEELISICKGREKAKEVSSAIYRSSPAEITKVMTLDEFFARNHDVIDLETEDAPEEVKEEIAFDAPDYSDYAIPPMDILSRDLPCNEESTDAEMQEISKKIVNILSEFGIPVTVEKFERGPRITRYELVPEKGIRANKIVNLADDIALCLGVQSIRMEAPIPGRHAIGIEVPNKNASVVRLRGILETEEFKSAGSNLTVAIGVDITGKPVLADIAKMPHLIVGGATGMGKSVCINSFITSMLYKAKPDEVKLLLIDPKQVEFTPFKDIPHLIMPIVHDPKKAASSLKWVVEEMERRYRLLSANDVRNIDAYNEKADKGSTLPRIVIIIDELADLMLQVKDQIEGLIMRIAQKSRAVGIHLILATQRPSVNVITGVIKANIPTRIAFKVMSSTDSKVLIDRSGAEKLLGKGDALYYPIGSPAPHRIQGAFISDHEVESLTKHIKDTSGEAVYDPNILSYVESEVKKMASGYENSRKAEKPTEIDYPNDSQFLDAVEVAISMRKISTSLIQRKLSIGYGKAAKFIDVMEEMGIVTEANGYRPREVIISAEEWKTKLEKIRKK